MSSVVKLYIIIPHDNIWSILTVQQQWADTVQHPGTKSSSEARALDLWQYSWQLTLSLTDCGKKPVVESK